MKNINSMFRLLPQLMITVLMFALSCKQEDPKPDCGCDAKTYKNVVNAKAVYYGSGNFTLLAENPSENSFVVACETDATWQKSTDENVPDYVISGRVKSRCFIGPTLIILPSHIQITSIKKQ
jgi:hypothetical protein